MPILATEPTHRRPVHDPDPSQDLCTSVLSRLRRRDQRHKGELYVQGLLTASGRKTMRHLAARTEERAAEQSLHHFISCSTWEWAPLRAALATRLTELLSPRAWVVRPLVIPKTGRHSVGVERRFVPHLGQVMNSQQGYTLWLASGAAAAPVNWRLLLGGDWLADESMRRRAAIPDTAGAASAPELAVSMARQTASWGAAPQPLVMDARQEEVAPLVDALRAAGLPFVLRIDPGTGLLAPMLPGTGARAMSASAGRLAELSRSQQRPVEWIDPAGPAVPRTSLVALLPVHLPGVRGPVAARAGWPSAGAAGAPLTLVGVRSPNSRTVSETWLTNMTGAARSTLLGLVRLVGRVDADFTDISLPVGALDFEGRSYLGWHRHTTLVSLAHAVRLLQGGVPRERAREVTALSPGGGRRSLSRGRFGSAGAAARAGFPGRGQAAASPGRVAG